MVDGISHDPKMAGLSWLRPGAVSRPEDMVCKPEPELFTAEPDRSALMPSGRAKASLPLDQVQASSALSLSVSDRNGLNRTGRDDITGTLDGTVSINQEVIHKALKPLVGHKDDGVHIKAMRFDAKSSSYVLSIEGSTAWGLLWDNFELKIRTQADGQLYLQVDENWMPDSSIISRVSNALQGMLKSSINGQQDVVSLKLETRRSGDKLFLTPVLDTIKVPLAKDEQLRIEGLNSARAGKFSLDSQGNLAVSFDSLHFSGSSDAKGAKAGHQGRADTASLEITAQLHKDNRTEVRAEGHISLDLDAQDVKQIAFGGENLAKRIESARLEARIDTDVSIDARGKIQAESRNNWRIEDAQIQGRRYDIVSDQIEVSLDTQSGLKLEVRTPAPKSTPFIPELSKNVIEPILGGPAYFQEMLNAIGGARESIELETFLMYAGDKTKDLMRALALKAAGLKQGNSRLVSDPRAAKGLPVHVLFNNNKLNHEGALPTIRQFEATVKELTAEIQALPISAKAKQDAVDRLQANLHWGSIERGVAKADHRKLLLIDGKTGYTGGINLGDHFLQPDSYHDIMLKLNGPAVRGMQNAFIDNWLDFTGEAKADWNSKSVKQLEQHRDRYAKEHKLTPTAAQVVTTDEDSSDIEAAYLHAIETATKSVTIEQAYYYYPPIQEALKRALARNVSVNLIVPERSDETVYDIVNLDQIRELMETQQRLGRGEVKAWLYTGTPGKYSHRAHTKALSADGNMAVIGSGNMTPRSLNSPFREELADGSRRQVLFNEEMSIYFEGDQVADIDRSLFEADKKKAIAVDYAEVLRRIKELGGDKVLQQNLLKVKLG